MSKFIKILIIINGILIPIIVLTMLYQVFKPFNQPELERNEGVIVGEEFEQAIKDSVAIQGLAYENPTQIYNSENFFLPLAIATFEESRDYGLAKLSAGDISYNLRYVVNIIFLDKKYNVITSLLDKKASITDFNIKPKGYLNESINENYGTLAFLIGFDDTNQDGKLNGKDHHDLYISDLNGKNLLQVSNGVDIVDFELTNDYDRINIRYKERTEQREEHKRIKFAYFDLGQQTWNELPGLNQTILDLENLIIK